MRNISETDLSHASISKGFFQTGQEYVASSFMFLYFTEIEWFTGEIISLFSIRINLKSFLSTLCEAVSCFELEFEMPAFL